MKHHLQHKKTNRTPVEETTDTSDLINKIGKRFSALSKEDQLDENTVSRLKKLAGIKK